MRNLDSFTHAPQTSMGRYTRNSEVAPELIKYLEDESDLRPYFVYKPITNALSKSYRISKDEGIAVQVAGNAEVPRAEDVEKMFTVFLMRNATGYKIDDDDRNINRDDPSYESKKMQRALERMLKKERMDMKNVFIAAAQGTMQYASTGITVNAIRDAVTTMITTNTSQFGTDQVEPDTIFMSYASFRTLQLDPDFKFIPEIFQRLLVDGKISEGTTRGPLSGPTGQLIDGLEIVLMNELGDDIILLDSRKEALWLCEDQAPKISKYRDEEHISDITDIRHDQQPVCVKPECLFKLTKQA